MGGAVIGLLVLATSAGAYLWGARARGRPPGTLGRAVARLLETLGLALAFLAGNLALGIAVVLGWRTATGEFLSAYVLDDAALLVLSLLQAVAYRWWQESHR